MATDYEVINIWDGDHDHLLSEATKGWRRRFSDDAVGARGGVDPPEHDYHQHPVFSIGFSQPASWLLQQTWTIGTLANRGHIRPGDLVALRSTGGWGATAIYLGPDPDGLGAAVMVSADEADGEPFAPGVYVIPGSTACGVLGCAPDQEEA